MYFATAILKITISNKHSKQYQHFTESRLNGTEIPVCLVKIACRLNG